MYTFINQRFPEDIAYGASGGPSYSTSVLAMASGAEQRNINWQEARIRYNVAHGVKTPQQMASLLAFFRNCCGRAYAFRFKDWADYQAECTPIGIGDGIAKRFQLYKTYHCGEYSCKRKITRLVAGSVQIFVNSDTPKLRGGAHPVASEVLAIDHDLGLIDFAAPPPSASSISASFEFDVPARFDTDVLNASLDDYHIHSWADISIIEVKE